MASKGKGGLLKQLADLQPGTSRGLDHPGAGLPDRAWKAGDRGHRRALLLSSRARGAVGECSGSRRLRLIVGHLLERNIQADREWNLITQQRERTQSDRTGQGNQRLHWSELDRCFAGPVRVGPAFK
jgi:hypothetical protein